MDSKGGSWQQSGGLLQPPWLARRQAKSIRIYKTNKSCWEHIISTNHCNRSGFFCKNLKNTLRVICAVLLINVITATVVFFYFHKLFIFCQKWLFLVVFVYLAQIFRHFLAKYILRKLYCRGIIQPFVFWAALHYFITAYSTYPFYKDSITTKKENLYELRRYYYRRRPRRHFFRF